MNTHPNTNIFTLVVEARAKTSGNFVPACGCELGKPCQELPECPFVYAENGQTVGEFDQFIARFQKLGYVGQLASHFRLGCSPDGEKNSAAKPDYRVFFAPEGRFHEIAEKAFKDIPAAGSPCTCPIYAAA